MRDNLGTVRVNLIFFLRKFVGKDTDLTLQIWTYPEIRKDASLMKSYSCWKKVTFCVGFSNRSINVLQLIIFVSLAKIHKTGSHTHSLSIKYNWNDPCSLYRLTINQTRPMLILNKYGGYSTDDLKVSTTTFQNKILSIKIN